MEKNKKPEWINKFKKPGTQIVRQKNNYYLYEVERVYDKITKKSKKKTKEYLGKITENGIIPPKHKRDKLKISDLDKTNNLLKRIQIIYDLESGIDKKKIANEYEMTIKTINNTKKRFDKDGINGLIHTRKSNVETVKVSTPEQAAIITDVIQNPDKSLDDIVASSGKNMDKASVKKLITPILEYLKLKKKVILEIE